MKRYEGRRDKKVQEYKVLITCVTASIPAMEFPPRNVTVLDGKDATINCRAVAAPAPNITWIYNGIIKKKVY